MVDNIPKNEYEQKQRQSYLIDRTRERREAEAEIQEEEEEPWDGTETVAYLPNQQNIQTKIQHKQRIGLWMSRLLLATAIVIDCIEIILEWLGIGLLGFSFLLGICASTIFWIWFLSLGVTYSSNTKKFSTAIIQTVIELIPGQDATLIIAFGWTIGMLIIIGMTIMEDRGEEPTIIGAFGEMMFNSYPGLIKAPKVVRNYLGNRMKKIGSRTEPTLQRLIKAKSMIPTAPKETGTPIKNNTPTLNTKK